MAGNVKFNFDQRAIDRIANEAISEVAAHAQQATACTASMPASRSLR